MNKVFIGGISGFKKYTAKFYDSRNNELYRKTFEAVNIKKARELAYNIMANTSDDSVKVKVSLA